VPANATEGVDPGVESQVRFRQPAIAPMIDAPSSALLLIAVIVAINVIRRRAANQFRQSGVLLVSQPGIAQKS
jgi:hypothetical protein